MVKLIRNFIVEQYSQISLTQVYGVATAIDR